MESVDQRVGEDNTSARHRLQTWDKVQGGKSGDKESTAIYSEGGAPVEDGGQDVVGKGANGVENRRYVTDCAVDDGLFLLHALQHYSRR